MKEFEKAINNDLDMPSALKVLWELLRDEKAEGKLKTIEKMDRVFGLKLLEKEEIEVPEDVLKLVKKRETARKGKNFKLADELREKIKKKGFSIDDTNEGVRIRKI